MRNTLLYSLMLLMSLTLSSCSGSEGIIPPPPEQSEHPDSDEEDGKDDNQQGQNSLKINITIGDLF